MNPTDLPRDLLGLGLAVLLLGIRHGVDADHLAAIDGLTRHNASRRPRLARLTGVLFCIGHGSIVVAVVLGVALLTRSWRTPIWLAGVGAWTSIAVLILLAMMNIANVLRTPPDRATGVVGWRSTMFGRLLRADNPATILGVGGLFALSFDTVSLAALFSVTAISFGDWRHALLVALLFVAGMLITDGINGWWIAQLIRRADQTALVASRVMSLAVAGVGLLTAALGIAAQTLPGVEPWADRRALYVSAVIVVVVGLSFIAGQRRAMRSNTTRPAAAAIAFSGTPEH